MTTVELVWIQGRIERWIRFGLPVESRIIDRKRRLLSFRPDSLFAYVRWASNEHGTIVSRLDIVRATRPGEQRSTIPGVIPGGEMLLRAWGWPRVSRVLALIDEIDSAGIEPAEVAPDHWRHVHHRLAAGIAPSPYGKLQHSAWLKRRLLGK